MSIQWPEDVLSRADIPARSKDFLASYGLPESTTSPWLEFGIYESKSGFVIGQAADDSPLVVQPNGVVVLENADRRSLYVNGSVELLAEFLAIFQSGAPMAEIREKMRDLDPECMRTLEDSFWAQVADYEECLENELDVEAEAGAQNPCPAANSPAMEIPTSTRSRILAPGKAQEDSTNRQTHFMQRKIIMIMAGAAVSCSIAHAEIDILSCVRKEVDVPSGVVSPLPPDRKTIGLTVYHVGETLGKAQLDDDRLSDLVSAALSEDQSEDPFFVQATSTFFGMPKGATISYSSSS